MTEHGNFVSRYRRHVRVSDLVYYIQICEYVLKQTVKQTKPPSDVTSFLFIIVSLGCVILRRKRRASEREPRVGVVFTTVGNAPSG